MKTDCLPGKIGFLGTGMLGLGLLRKKGRAGVVLAVLLACVFSVRARAQGQDYSNVDDFLNGRRTLLSIDDLVISGTVSAPTGSAMSMLALGTTNSQLAPIATNTWGAGLLNYYQVTKTYTARMWNTPNAATIVLGTNAGIFPSSLSFPNLPYYVGSWPSYGAYFFDPVFGSHSYPAATGLAVADFNQDGYDDLVLNFNDGTTVVATAGDVNNINAGSSPPLYYGPASKLDILADMTIGDFNGDGHPEIAGLVQLPSGGLALVIYTVDPNTLAVSKAAQITLQKAGTSSMAAVSIASGRFTPAAHDQIIVAYTPNGVVASTLELIDFAPPSLTPQEETTYAFGSGFEPQGGVIKVKTGKFGLPTIPYDQVVFMFAWYGDPRPLGSNTKYFNILSIDPTTFAWKQSLFDEFSNQDCALDIAVGNVDNRQADPASPGQTGHNPNSQIALLYGSCYGAKSVNIVNVDPTSFAPSGLSQ
jgi:hypothetical protein